MSGEQEVPSAEELAQIRAEIRERGLYGKFRVERVDGKDQPGGPKADARYFVLDYVHDQHARVALRAYAQSCRNPQLAADLLDEIGSTDD